MKQFKIRLEFDFICAGEDELEALDEAYACVDIISEGDSLGNYAIITELPPDQEMLDANDREGES